MATAGVSAALNEPRSASIWPGAIRTWAKSARRGDGAGWSGRDGKAREPFSAGTWRRTKARLKGHGVRLSLRYAF